MPNNAANKDQATLWNGAGGQTWVEMQPVLDRMLAPFTEVLIDAAAGKEVRRALDVGCGAGATTIALGERLGPPARVTGIDISAPLIEAARARTKDAAGPVDFRLGDAQTEPFESAAYDLVLSRFGVMFFDDPVAAFTNLRRAARPGAPLVFIAWRGPEENPFFTLAQRAASQFVALPAPAGDAPGQFAFAHRERVAGILSAAGWRDAAIAPVDVATRIDADDLGTYVTRLGPMGQLLPTLPEAVRSKVKAAIVDAYRPLAVNGAARFVGACWLVTATA